MEIFWVLLFIIEINGFVHSDVGPVVGSNILRQTVHAAMRQRRREQYSAMSEVDKDILLTKKREYYKGSKVVRECPPNVAFLSPDGTTQEPNKTNINQSVSYQLTKCTDPVETPPNRNNIPYFKSPEPSLDNGQTTQNLQSNIHGPTSNT
jgi:hypothetical protein